MEIGGSGDILHGKILPYGEKCRKVCLVEQERMPCGKSLPLERKCPEESILLEKHFRVDRRGGLGQVLRCSIMCLFFDDNMCVKDDHKSSNKGH